MKQKRKNEKKEQKKNQEKQKGKQEENISRSNNVYYYKIFFKVLHHYFKNLKSMMRKLTDPRIKMMCTYVIEYMIFTGILFFILKL